MTGDDESVENGPEEADDEARAPSPEALFVAAAIGKLNRRTEAHNRWVDRDQTPDPIAAAISRRLLPGSPDTGEDVLSPAFDLVDRVLQEESFRNSEAERLALSLDEHQASIERALRKKPDAETLTAIIQNTIRFTLACVQLQALCSGAIEDISTTERWRERKEEGEALRRAESPPENAERDAAIRAKYAEMREAGSKAKNAATKLSTEYNVSPSRIFQI